jgi:DNA polymerase/3'-5' exonuclease PolX
MKNETPPAAPEYPFDYAAAIATRIYYDLLPHCDKIEVAGSLKRRNPIVKDIEIVCLPKEYATDLLGEYSERIPEFDAAVRELGETVKGFTRGRYMKIRHKSGICIDLFMPIEEDFYRILAIRIGPSEYSHRVIADAWTKKGWVGTSMGLRRKSDCRERKQSDGKTTWIPNRTAKELPPVWQSEKEFFDWLGVEYKEPKERRFIDPAAR